MAFRTIQPMGKSPNAAPLTAAATAIEPGMWKTAIATRSAAASPSRAATWAFTWKKASDPSSTTTGSAATSAETNRFPSGV